MNKKLTMIKIIDLLNKEANSEKMPKEIKYKDIIYIYSNYYKDYVERNSEIHIEANTGFLQNIELLKCLNEYVEILEEDKPIIEKLRISRNDITYGDGAINGDELVDAFLDIKDKINEIIDCINRKEG